MTMYAAHTAYLGTAVTLIARDDPPDGLFHVVAHFNEGGVALCQRVARLLNDDESTERTADK